MKGFERSSVPAAAGGPEDMRIGEILAARDPEAVQERVVIMGFPVDEGVILNGGRRGASEGPDAIRKAFFTLTPDPFNQFFIRLLTATRDAGNLIRGSALEASQETLGDAVSEALTEGRVCVILGGGHETAYGHFLGYAKANRRVSILNLDAHPDVRPLKEGRGHSGSPFRQAIEHISKACISYTVAGILPYTVAGSHLAYVEEKKGAYLFGQALTLDVFESYFAKAAAPVMLSIDLDVVDRAYAPGVSAPATGGIQPALLFGLAYLAGRSPFVQSIDIVELCPGHDVDGITARLAAVTLWHFFKGLSERG